MLTTGQKVTLLRIDDACAMSHRYEFTVKTVLDGAPVGYEGRQRRVAHVVQKGKRSAFCLDLKADDILLDGWDLPVKVDTEIGGVMCGNACYNLVGDAETIRQLIEGKAIVPVTDSAKGKILVSAGPKGMNDGVLLYPDIQTRHAVIDRIKEKLASA